MDKNTLTGLVLIAAVMFGFMYLSKPSDEQIAAEKERREQAVRDAQAAVDEASKSVETIVPTAADSSALAAAVRMMGTADTARPGVYAYSDDTFSLTADTAGLHGTATVGTESVDIVEFLASRSALEPAAANGLLTQIRDLSANAARYEGFSRYLGGEEQAVVLKNDSIVVTLASRGAMVSQVELLAYKTEVRGDTSNVLLFTPGTDGYGFTFATSEQRIDTRDFNFTVEEVSEDGRSVLFAMHPSENSMWGVRYTLRGYVLSAEIVQQGMTSVLPPSTSSIDFNWHQKMARNELGRTFEERNSAIYYKYYGDNPDDLSANSDDQESLNGRIKWVAFKNQFFSSVVIARDAFTTADLKSVVIKDDRYLKDMSMASTLAYSAGDGTPVALDFYFGPNDYPLLSSLDDTLQTDEDLDLTRLIPLGWGLFRWINTLIVIPVFTFLGSFISNYGLIILLLTLFIKLIIFPFTFKSYKSQARMRVLAPEIKEINEKYPGQENALKRQQETMSLYSRVGASPFSGCLPMLLQMPVLIAMFSFFPSAIELRGQSFLWAHDLSAPDVIFTLPFSIPFYGSHVSLFCLLMTVVNIIYTRINMASQPGGSSMPGMKIMTYLMPVMFLFFFNDYASGLSYYYFLSLLITIVQTWIFRRCIDEQKVRADLFSNAAKGKKKKGFMARLEEAQRKQQAMLRQQQAQNAKRRK